MTASRALIVDDEPDIRELLEITLGRMNIHTETAADVTEAKNKLSSEEFDLCLTDMKLPDGNGIELVKHIQENHTNLPVAVLTAFGSMDTAITALKAGAFDFVSKPIDLQRLRGLVEKALTVSQIKDGEEITDSGATQLIGSSTQIKQLKNQIKKLALSQAPVYISGESGSGKELVARLIHELGPRSDQPFVPVNCGAIPGELMESEFFGHKKGSFTGAIENKVGLFQAAQGGTLFLDEVADLPLHMQVKLLRAIQEKSVRPIGEQKEIPVDIRILSATHKDLQKQVDSNLFRKDLFYRINVIQLNVPALRERKEDIATLANIFLQRLAKQWDLTVPHISESATKALLRYEFPGNVRELENVLERALTLCDADMINAEHLQLPTSDEPVEIPVLEEISSAPPLLEPIPEFDGNFSLEEYLTDIEKKAILGALESTRWNRTAAAKKLGMSFRSLRYRLKKLGLDEDSSES